MTDDELRPASSFDELAESQVEVVAALRSRHMIAPMVCLQAVVPTANHLERLDFMDNLEEVAAARRPTPELPDQQLFEHCAGRALEPDERARGGTVYKR